MVITSGNLPNPVIRLTFTDLFTTFTMTCTLKQQGDRRQLKEEQRDRQQGEGRARRQATGEGRARRQATGEGRARRQATG